MLTFDECDVPARSDKDWFINSLLLPTLMWAGRYDAGVAKTGDANGRVTRTCVQTRRTGRG